MMTHKQQGFTLIELMIAVAIVGILATVAYPSYLAQIRKSNRVDAKVELEHRSQGLEKCYTRFMAYDNGACAPFTTAGNTASGLYAISAQNLTASTYTLRATPIGRQVGDKCSTIDLLSTGERQSTGGTVKECW